MAGISFNIACKELKIAQIAQLNQLFQLLHLLHIYGHGFCELSHMLMRENVNNDVNKDSPILVGVGDQPMTLGLILGLQFFFFFFFIKINFIFFPYIKS